MGRAERTHSGEWTRARVLIGSRDRPRVGGAGGPGGGGCWGGVPSDCQEEDREGGEGWWGVAGSGSGGRGVEIKLVEGEGRQGEGESGGGPGATGKEVRGE